MYTAAFPWGQMDPFGGYLTTTRGDPDTCGDPFPEVDRAGNKPWKLSDLTQQ